MKTKKRKLKRKKQRIHNQKFNGNSNGRLKRLLTENKPERTLVMEKFVIELSSRLELKPLDFLPRIQNTGISVQNGCKRYSERKMTRTLNYLSDKYKLIFSEYDNQTVELWWIEVFNKGIGLGTEILNSILNVSDELEIRVRVIPVDFDNKEKKIENLIRLRDWYKSFGFKSIDYNRTPVLFYEPQEITLKQVS